MQRTDHFFGLCPPCAWLLSEWGDVCAHQRGQRLLQQPFQRVETLLALCWKGSLRQPFNYPLHTVGIERLERAPAQTRL